MEGKKDLRIGIPLVKEGLRKIERGRQKFADA